MPTAAALRQQRYRERKRKRNTMAPLPVTSLPSPVTAVTAAVSALCDALENITPEQVADALDAITALGVAGDARLASAWLVALEVLAASRAGR